MIQVDTRLLSRGIIRPTKKTGVTIVTPLDELTAEDREDLREFASFVLSQHASTPRAKRKKVTTSQKRGGATRRRSYQR